MATQTYNGWKNWETWNVMLWLDNEEPLYRDYTRAVRTGVIHDEYSLCEYIMDLMPTGTPDFDHPSEYLKVDWAELWEHMQED